MSSALFPHFVSVRAFNVNCSAIVAGFLRDIFQQNDRTRDSNGAVDGYQHIDHEVVDIDVADQHSCVFLVLRANASVKPPTSTFPSFSLPVRDLSLAVQKAVDIGGVVLTELVDEAVHIQSPFGFAFVLVQGGSAQPAQRVSLLRIHMMIYGYEGGTQLREQGSAASAAASATITTSFPSVEASSKSRRTRKLWDSITGRINPNIHPYLLISDSYRLVTPNAVKPIPFSNEFFEGHAILLLNSSLPMDEKFAQRFAKDHNKFEVQIQGRFKKVPPGAFMYLGGEITKRMELGILTRGICTSILQFCRSFNPSLHHSYGDSENIELPHIVAPFWSTIDRLIVTPDGSTPPPMSVPFPEDRAQRTVRRGLSFQQGVCPDIDLTSTYSFSLKTQYVNLETWSVVNIPLMKEFKLQTFWAEADLRFVAYFIDPKEVEVDSKGFPKRHTQKNLRRFFSMELQHRANHPEWRDDPSAPYYANQPATSDSEAEDEVLTNRLSEDMSSVGVGGGVGDMEMDEEDGTAIDLLLNGGTPSNPSTRVQREAVVYDDDDSVDESAFFDTQVGHDEAFHAHLSTPSHIPHRPQPSASATFDSSTLPISQSLVPEVVEVDEVRGSSASSRRVLYAFACNPHQNPGEFVLRSFREWKAVLPLAPVADSSPNFHRLSESAQRRLQLEESHRNVLQDKSLAMQLQSFLRGGRTLAESLPAVRAPTVSSSGPSAVPLPDAHVFVQRGNHHWCQELLSLQLSGNTATSTTSIGSIGGDNSRPMVVLFRSSKGLGRGHKEKIFLDSILHVGGMSADRITSMRASNLYGVVISTLPRLYLLLIHGREARDAWVAGLKVLMNRRTRSGSFSSSVDPKPKSSNTSMSSFLGQKKSASTASEGVRSLSDEKDVASGSTISPGLTYHPSLLLSNPPNWTLGDRVILNGRVYLRDQSIKALGHLIESTEEPTASVCREDILHTSIRQRLELQPLPEYVGYLLEIAFLLVREYQIQQTTTTTLAAAAASMPIMVSLSCVQGSAKEVVSYTELWVLFLTGVSMLSHVDVSAVLSLSTAQATALYLNLFHVLLLHGFLVLGLPTSLFRWTAFFRSTSYEAFGDIFSLAELEHNIIKTGLHKPNVNVLAQSLLPHSTYLFALTQRDYRLAWAINCASPSVGRSSVPVYTAERLGQQLDYNMSVCLNDQSVFDSGDRNRSSSSSTSQSMRITLPQLCSWYSRDIVAPAISAADLGYSGPLGEGAGDDSNQRGHRSEQHNTRALLRALKPYFRGAKRERLENMLSPTTVESSRVQSNVKYSSYEFSSRWLSLSLQSGECGSESFN